MYVSQHSYRRRYSLQDCSCSRSTLLGIGLMLSSSEITRIAGAFGLDTSTRANIMSAVYTAQTAVHTGKAIVQAVSK